MPGRERHSEQQESPAWRDNLAGRLEEILARWGIAGSQVAADQLGVYLDLLWEWNKVFRLTGERSREDLLGHQVVDSLTVAPLISSKGSLVDIGSGAGFPGLVLKIYLQRKEVWLVESNHHRANFLREVKRALGIEGLVVWEGRAQDLGREGSLREGFSEAVTKAFGRTGEFLRSCYPILRPGGLALAMVGQRSAEGQIDNSSKGFVSLGGRKIAYRWEGEVRSRLILEFCKRPADP